MKNELNNHNENYEENECNSDSYISEEENNIDNFQSKLGEKEYWDEFYNKEINQFKNNSDLIGEVWFGEHTQNKVVHYIKDNFVDKNIKILDVGCGNAAFILKLSNLTFTNLFGMDYSEKSIEFANQILKEKLDILKFNKIVLYQEDINNYTNFNTEFDLIHDKGTFDAFMLHKENISENYLKFIIKNAKNNSTFIITSCNHSKSELLNYFNTNNFILLNNIPHKSLNFGGSQGQLVTTLVFTINLN